MSWYSPAAPLVLIQRQSGFTTTPPDRSRAFRSGLCRWRAKPFCEGAIQISTPRYESQAQSWYINTNHILIDVLKTLDLQPRTGLGKQLTEAENDASNILKKEGDIEDHDQLHFQAKKESVNENLQTRAKPAEDDLRAKKKLIEEDVRIKEEPADEHMHVRAERAEDDVRVKEEPLEDNAHI